MIDSTTAKTPTMVLDERLGENQRGILVVNGERIYVNAYRNTAGDVVLTLEHPMLDTVKLQRADGKAVIGIMGDSWMGV